LAENYDFIPHGSSVLDMGMGEGRNAVFLAQKGYVVTGIDISSVAVKKARILAKEYNVKLQTVVASLDKYRIKDGSFDSIIVFYYVDRTLIDKMMNWLKPGGILIYEAYTIEQRKKESFKDDPEEYFLKPQELLSMFKNIKILKYEEPEHSKDKRASIILKKL
jgi:tellurite methyltransferase